MEVILLLVVPFVEEVSAPGGDFIWRPHFHLLCFHLLYFIFTAYNTPNNQGGLFPPIVMIYPAGAFVKPLVRSQHTVFSSHSFWTSSSLDVPARVTLEEGHTGIFIHLLIAVCALIFLAKKNQPFLSLVDREVEFCVLTI